MRSFKIWHCFRSCVPTRLEANWWQIFLSFARINLEAAWSQVCACPPVMSIRHFFARELMPEIEHGDCDFLTWEMLSTGWQVSTTIDEGIVDCALQLLWEHEEQQDLQHQVEADFSQCSKGTSQEAARHVGADSVVIDQSREAFLEVQGWWLEHLNQKERMEVGTDDECYVLRWEKLPALCMTIHNAGASRFWICKLMGMIKWIQDHPWEVLLGWERCWDYSDKQASSKLHIWQCGNLTFLMRLGWISL